MWVGRVGSVEWRDGKVGEMGVVVMGTGYGEGREWKWER